MILDRRHAIAGPAALALLGGKALAAEPKSMFGLIGKMTALPGKRAELIAAILGFGDMPGCLSYVVAEDAKDSNALWITEVWDSEASHDASLKLPEVQAAIARGRPLIAGFEPGATTRPVGGVGLKV